MVLAGLLIASHSQVNALRLDLVEESEDCVASHDLSIEIVRLERLQLRVAILPVHHYLFVAAELLELGSVDVPRWRQFGSLVALVTARTEQLCIKTQLDHQLLNRSDYIRK